MLSNDGRAVMYPRLAVTRDLHNERNNNKSRTPYLKAQQMKVKWTMPISRTSFGPTVRHRCYAEGSTNCFSFSWDSVLFPTASIFSAAILNVVLNTSLLPCAWRQSTNNSRNNLCQPRDRNTPCNGNSAVVVLSKR